MTHALAPQSLSATLTFTAAERAALASLEVRGFSVETCADDGAEWAALIPSAVADDPFRLELPETHAATVQLTSEPGRRFVVLGPDGRRVMAAGDDLAAALTVATASH